MVKNVIKLNIPAHSGGSLPYPDEPLVTLNGQPIEHLVFVKVECDGRKQNMNIVTLGIEAAVDGEFIVEERTIGG